MRACVPWLPSLQCNDDWVSPLDWLHSCSAIPLSTVRNHLVSLGLLQSNWPFKEGLHHVKQCNWEWYSHCSVPHFVLHLSGSPFSGLTSRSLSPLLSSDQLLSVCLCLSTSCSPCCSRALSSADSRWPLKARRCRRPCYSFSAPDSSSTGQTELYFQEKSKIALWSGDSVSSAVSEGAAAVELLKVELSTQDCYTKRHTAGIQTATHTSVSDSNTSLSTFIFNIFQYLTPISTFDYLLLVMFGTVLSGKTKAVNHSARAPKQSNFHHLLFNSDL